MFDLRGRTALVTGAGQGVGAEIARTFAAAGATVVVNDLFAERAEEVASALTSTGARALAIAADVTDRGAVQAMVERAASEVGPVDILVNNAGVPPLHDWALVPFATTDPDTWAQWVDINFYGVLHCCHAVLPAMIEHGWGRIVNIVSDGGRVGEALMAVYCGAKAAATGFSRALAKEVASQGITVNCVALGNLYDGRGDPAIAERIAKRYPVGRVGSASDVAPAVLYLSSPEAEWVTGQTLPVNGGYSTS